jgi:hypothetical protein
VLFEIVSRALRDARPHPEERACRRSVANSKPRTRVSKDEDEPVRAPSCFETHRSGLGLWKQLRSPGAAMPLSMRVGGRGVFWRNEADRHLTKRSEADVCVFGPRGGPTWGCTKSPPVRLPCFRPVIYRERCNFNVSSGRRAGRRPSASRSVALYFPVTCRSGGAAFGAAVADALCACGAP